MERRAREAESMYPGVEWTGVSSSEGSRLIKRAAKEGRHAHYDRGRLSIGGGHRPFTWKPRGGKKVR
jgi:hypothetical protein